MAGIEFDPLYGAQPVQELEVPTEGEEATNGNQANGQIGDEEDSKAEETEDEVEDDFDDDIEDEDDEEEDEEDV
jgi:hypothetical protein